MNLNQYSGRYPWQQFAIEKRQIPLASADMTGVDEEQRAWGELGATERTALDGLVFDPISVLLDFPPRLWIDDVNLALQTDLFDRGSRDHRAVARG